MATLQQIWATQANAKEAATPGYGAWYAKWRAADLANPVTTQTFGGTRPRAAEYIALTNEGIRNKYIEPHKQSWLQKSDVYVAALGATVLSAGALGAFSAGAVAGANSSGGFSAAEIAAGSDAGTLFAPAAVTPTVSAGMTATQATMMGTTGLGAAGSLVKPVLQVATAAAGLAGAVQALKGANSQPAINLPAYMDQNTAPTTAAGIVKPNALAALAAGNQNAILLFAAGALLVVFLVKRRK